MNLLRRSLTWTLPKGDWGRTEIVNCQRNAKTFEIFNTIAVDLWLHDKSNRTYDIDIERQLAKWRSLWRIPVVLTLQLIERPVTSRNNRSPPNPQSSLPATYSESVAGDLSQTRCSTIQDYPAPSGGDLPWVFSPCSVHHLLTQAGGS